MLIKIGLLPVHLRSGSAPRVPRVRYDQLMTIGWKVLLPLATLNLLVTSAFVVAYA